MTPPISLKRGRHQCQPRHAHWTRRRAGRLAMTVLGLLAVCALGTQLTVTAVAAGPRIVTGRPTGTLEDWANSVLRDVAVGAGRPVESLRTPERVLFMVLWAVAEGGGVGNAYGRFNPLNTSLTTSDLGGIKTGPHGVFATVDYPTYDLGVEAAARTIEGRYQKRIRAALLSPNPNAGELITAVVHPEWTKGDACWACTGNLTTPGYEQLLRQVGGNVRVKWAKYAKRVMVTTRRATTKSDVMPRAAGLGPTPMPAPDATTQPAPPSAPPPAAVRVTGATPAPPAPAAVGLRRMQTAR